MEVLVLGLNHKTAPVELRERLSIPQGKIDETFESLERRRIFNERLLLSTCNRTEIYGTSDNFVESVRAAKSFFSEYSQLPLKQFEDNLYILKQPDSVRHLFSVASGLDSMVVGETEIIGQVKEAYAAAHKLGQTGKVLNTLFQRSFKVAKLLRSDTQIGNGNVGVASIAVNLAEKIFGSLDKTRAMVIGTGGIATQITQAMSGRGAIPMIVSHRHAERAEDLAKRFGGAAVNFEHYEAFIKDTDILIAATGAPLLIIHEKEVRAWMKTRHERPLFLIDISVPRNIEPAVEKLDNVYLYNIDDLEAIAAENRVLRDSQLDQCTRLIGNQTGHFMSWFSKEFNGNQAKASFSILDKRFRG